MGREFNVGSDDKRPQTIYSTVENKCSKKRTEEEKNEDETSGKHLAENSIEG